jgi:DNA-binding MarR family transcriptional regulator
MQDERLRTSLANAVVRLFRQVNRVHNRAFKDLGISAEQAHILSVLSTMGPMTIGALGRIVDLSSATLTGAIDRMEAQDLVRRTPAPDDKRAFVVEARHSAKKQAQIDAVIAAGERQCFGHLTATERRELLRLMDKCIGHLEPDAVTR